KAIAQTTLAGGGEAEQGRASSPLPPARVNDAGDAMEMGKASRLQALQEQQNLLLADAKNQLALLATPDPVLAMLPSELQQQEEKRRQLSKLLAEIEQRINSENARPKKRYISPSTQAKTYAAYYDSLRQRIEDRGTANFPSDNGVKLYGELTMIVTINHDGRVLQTEVVQGSGSPVLDRQAEAIARSVGPFGPFTPAMRKEADQLLVVSRFRFTRDNTLEAKVNTAP
ncbi:MAG: TonB family protein, partial [Rhodoferax sp.]|nr:TonB family protein [Rhodoferax sp.]